MFRQIYRRSAALFSPVGPMLTLLLSVLAVAQTADANLPLDVRAGLYELTVVTIMRAQITAEASAKMTPEQRRFTANIYAQRAKPQTQKITFCAGPSNMMPAAYLSGDASCVKKIVSSEQKFSAHMTCSTGEESYEFERIDGEHFKGVIRKSAANGSLTIEQTRNAKWMRDSCAKTPPPAPVAAANPSAGAAPVTSTASAQTPPMRVRSIQQTYGYGTVVVNQSKTPIAAYVIDMLLLGAGQGRLHYYDARMDRNSPIKPGASLVEKQVGIIVDAKPVAAIFADGTTFGDARQIAVLMNRRSYKLKALTTMTSILCDAERRGLDKEAAIRSIESARDSEPNGNTAMNSAILADGFRDTLSLLKLKPPSRPISMDQALKSILAIGTPLLEDGVKDPNGIPYIKTGKEALVCDTAH